MNQFESRLGVVEEDQKQDQDQITQMSKMFNLMQQALSDQDGEIRKLTKALKKKGKLPQVPIEDEMLEQRVAELERQVRTKGDRLHSIDMGNMSGIQTTPQAKGQNFDPKKLEAALNDWIEKVETQVNEIEARIVERPTMAEFK